MSDSVSFFVLISISGLINIYVFVISYIYCPSGAQIFSWRMTEEERQEHQIKIQ